MGAKSLFKRVSLGVVAAFIFVGLSTASVSAHVTVKPGEVKTAAYQVFTVSVPNEKDIPTTAVRVVIPKTITNVTPTQKSGWTIAIEKDNDQVTALVWQGGEVAVDTRDEFTFNAKTPVEVGNVEWKAYQTYADGTVVAWDQAETEGTGHDGASPDKGPFSVTSVTTGNSEAVASEEVEEAKSRADRALYIAGAAVLISLIAVYFATRKKRA